MEAAAAFPVSADSGFLHIVFDPAAKMIVVGKGVKRRHMLYENNVGLVEIWPSIFYIINDCPPNSIRNRECQRLMGFVLDKRQLLLIPVKVSKTKIFYITDPQAEDTGKNDHCIIPFPDRAVPVDSCNHAL